MTYPIALTTAAALCLIPALASADTRTLTQFDGKDSLRWQTVNDGVMGGVSQGDYSKTQDGTLLFSGEISLENNGGFSSIRTRSKDLQLDGYDGLEIKLRGDGRTYYVSLRTKDTNRWVAYWAKLKTKDSEWTTVRIPFSKWYPTTFGRKLRGPKLKTSSINSVGFMLYDKQAGPFALEVASIAAFKGAGEPKAVAKQGGPPNLVETAQQAGSFKTLLAAAKAAGLVDALSGEGPLTVFAPSDEAFAKLPKGTVKHLLKPENKDALKAVLLHHVVAGDVSLPALLRAPRLSPLGGQRLQVIRDGGALKVGESTVAAAGIRCSNGVIHVVDQVILPELRDLATVAVEAKTFSTLVAAAKAAGLVDALTGDQPLTVFAPTDDAFAKLPEGTVASLLKPENKDALKRVLLHHVVLGRVYSDAAAAAGKAPSLAKTELAFTYANGLQVNGTQIVATDIAARNGVIHVVDSVLLPPALEVKASAQAPAARAKSVIELAIDTGAPLYNDGNPEACTAVYELAATALLGLDKGLFSERVRAKLRKAVDSSENADDKAWSLRRALDAAYEQLRDSLKK